MLFDKIIFGPVKSRRLGVSLGVNLLNVASKHCNFDCIYCECGWNGDHPKGDFNPKQSVITRLESKLIEMKNSNQCPDAITFAGNGEPTMHPDFEQIIEETIKLRDQHAPNAKVSVLSNATMIDRENIVRALKMVDMNILKLDSAILETQKRINKANVQKSVEEQIELLKQFAGQATIQTMFIKGVFEGKSVDNTTSIEVEALLEAYKKINPKAIMLYSIDRETPAKEIIKVSKEELEKIADKVKACGFDAIVS